MTYVLRKSFGAHSAGTRVDEVLDNEVYYFAIGKTEVPINLVVKRRSMTRMVPTTNSRERRAIKRAAKRKALQDG